MPALTRERTFFQYRFGSFAKEPPFSGMYASEIIKIPSDSETLILYLWYNNYIVYYDPVR